MPGGCGGQVKAEASSGGLSSTSARNVLGGDIRSWWGAGRRAPWPLTRTPATDVDHRLSAAGAGRGAVEGGQWLRGFEVARRELPGLALGVGEQGRFAQQGADAIEAEAGGGVPPAEGAHPVEAGGKNVLD